MYKNVIECEEWGENKNTDDCSHYSTRNGERIITLRMHTSIPWNQNWKNTNLFGIRRTHFHTSVISGISSYSSNRMCLSWQNTSSLSQFLFITNAFMRTIRRTKQFFLLIKRKINYRYIIQHIPNVHVDVHFISSIVFTFPMWVTAFSIIRCERHFELTTIVWILDWLLTWNLSLRPL